MKKNTVGLVLETLIILLGVVCHIYSMCVEPEMVITNAIVVMMFIFLGYYLFIGYKEPHGNLLKAVMGIFAIPVIATQYATYNNIPKTHLYDAMLILFFVGYVCGRLGKREKNIDMFIIISLLTLLNGFHILKFAEYKINFITLVIAFSLFLQWVCIIGAYFLRYDEHIEAGKKYDREKAENKTE